MENFNTQKFISDARSKGVPDAEIYSYLNSKSLIPKEAEVKPIGSEAAKKESILKSIAADPFRTLIEKPATALGRVAGLATAGVADIIGKDEFADRVRTAALEKEVPSIIGGKTVKPIAAGEEGAKQITGDTLQIGSYLFPYGKVASAVGKVSKPLVGATIAGGTGGYMQDIGFKLSDGESDLTPGVATALGVGLPIVGKGISKLAGATKKAIPSTEDTIGKIIQGKSKDKLLAQKAISNIDTTNVKTFKELSERLKTSMDNEIAKVDNALLQDTSVYKLDDLTVGATDNAGNVIKTDYVGEALKNLDELYQTTGDNVSASNVKLLAQKAVE